MCGIHCNPPPITRCHARNEQGMPLSREERLCLFASLSRATPMRICFDHCVEDYEQFPHTSDNDNLGRLAFGSKPIGKGSYRWVVSLGRQGCHVQHASDIASSSEYVSSSSEFPAVAVEWCYANKCRDLFSVKLAEFRKFSDQCI